MINKKMFTIVFALSLVTLQQNIRGASAAEQLLSDILDFFAPKKPKDSKKAPEGDGAAGTQNAAGKPLQNQNAQSATPTKAR